MAETEHFKIAIIGSGPGGMSAAGRAAANGVSHILLERTDHLSDTIYKYQKGKHVMATPDILPLRSPMDFEAGTRENILDIWNSQLEDLDANVRFKAELTALTGEKGNFELTINGKDKIIAENVILAIGLQGNLRKMGLENDDWERVQYQLDDPDEYEDENIAVIGAGDAAIENAVALSGHNNVTIINRRGEFARAKDGNRALIEAAIEEKRINCLYDASPDALKPGELTLKTKAGHENLKVDRIIARLGAIPPRKFVEACGIEFPSDDITALPELNPHYESNVAGIYIIGALGGYPLIKQAMNQGYEVVEFILGNDIKPADEPLLEDLFSPLGDRFTVDEAIDWLRETVPLISGLTALQLREFLIDSTIRLLKDGETVFEVGDFGTTVCMIADGSVAVQLDPDDPSKTAPLGQGTFFGEIAMVSARPRTATVLSTGSCILVESPRRTMIKLMNSVRSVKNEIREAAMARQLRAYLSHEMSDELISSVMETAERKDFEPGQILFQEGDEADGIYIIRKGSVTTSRGAGSNETLLSYVPAGSLLGEVGVVGGANRYLTARAAVQVAATWIAKDKFMQIMDELPEFKQQVESQIVEGFVEDEAMSASQEAGNVMQFLVDQGMGEATDILLIDETLCVACDNCETACAETHGGISRLDRAAGPTFANIHVPTSCRHCEDPYCMSDCPADAIHKSSTGEVFIDEKCIGCENCKNNCPYGVIQMSYPKPQKPGLLSWLLFGSGPGPGHDDTAAISDAVKTAVKCDSCIDIDGGPSCVRACPTGAAFRVAPEEFFTVDQLVK